MARQALNVARMRLLGAQVVAVDSGSRTLKDAINEAMRDWVTNVRTTHYLLGSVLGAHPYPTMVRDFQSIIGREAREQILAAEKRLPTYLFACVGGGSNAIGLFYAFLRDSEVKMVGIEAGGRGCELGEHAARLAAAQGYAGARPGVLQGTYTYDQRRAQYSAISDSAALDAARLLARTEGIIPALESAHAIAGLIERRAQFTRDDLIILNLSGRGDKDMDTYSRLLG
jgi:tryptophan synthase beta chain